MMAQKAIARRFHLPSPTALQFMIVKDWMRDSVNILSLLAFIINLSEAVVAPVDCVSTSQIQSLIVSSEVGFFPDR